MPPRQVLPLLRPGSTSSRPAKKVAASSREWLKKLAAEYAFTI
jgi:hypothetical protein